MAPLLARRPACDRTFEGLYRRHAGDVYRYALALLRDPTEAEDATQTAFLNAYRALVRGEEPRSPKAWLLAIAHNVCRMRRRTLARRPREVPLDDHPLTAVDDERPRLDVVLAALAELPLNQRAALVMREVEGRSYREIAEVLGVSTSAVEALVFRARRRLRVRREALGALAAAPLPTSLGALPGGVVAAAIGSDVALKAAAGVIAALLAGGAAYKAGTGLTAEGATTPGSKRIPVARILLAARARDARPQHRTKPASKTAPARRRSASIVVVRSRRRAQPRLRQRPTRQEPAVVAPVATTPSAPPTEPPSPPPSQTLPSSPHLSPLPPVTTPSLQVPAVSAPQVPTVTVATPPPVPQLPDPPPLPKIP